MAEAQFWIGIHGVIAESGRLLVLKRAPRMTYRPGNWDLPGGHLAVNENFDECLLREIDEETGLEVEIERMLGLNKMPNRPYVQALYACRPLGARREIRLQPWEHVEARWLTLDELAAIESRIPYLDAILTRGLLDYLK
ncbi:MAG: NUDIX domain-containing protein [Candidatus Binataceae bacterium]